MKTLALLSMIAFVMACTGCASDSTSTTTTTEENTVVTHPVSATSTETTMQRY